MKNKKLIVSIIVCTCISFTSLIVAIALIKQTSNTDISSNKILDSDKDEEESDFSDEYIDFEIFEKDSQYNEKVNFDSEINTAYIYGQGHFFLSDDDFTSFSKRAILGNSTFATEEDVKEVLDMVRTYIKEMNFEAAESLLLNFVDNHYFNDSCYARELILLYEDNSVVGEFIASANSTKKARLAASVNDPMTALLLSSSISDPTDNLLNPKSYFLTKFNVKDSGYRLDNTDEHYSTANSVISYEPIDIYKFRIDKDGIDYFAYVCYMSNLKTYILQFETTDGNLEIHKKQSEKETVDFSKYYYNSNIYDNRED